jgi:hypothetical protein
VHEASSNVAHVHGADAVHALLCESATETIKTQAMQRTSAMAQSQQQTLNQSIQQAKTQSAVRDWCDIKHRGNSRKQVDKYLMLHVHPIKLRAYVGAKAISLLPACGLSTSPDGSQE